MCCCAWVMCALVLCMGAPAFCSLEQCLSVTMFGRDRLLPQQQRPSCHLVVCAVGPSLPGRALCLLGDALLPPDGSSQLWVSPSL